MRKLYLKFILYCLFYLLPIAAFSQLPTWQWTIGNQYKHQGKESLVTDRAGNIYTAAWYLSKYSPNGNQFWTHNLGGVAGAVGTAQVIDLAIDSADNVIVVGYFLGTIQLDTISLTASALEDAFIAKFNAQGAIQWAKKAGGIIPKQRFPGGGFFMLDDVFNSITIDSSGNSFVTGSADNNPGDTLMFDNYVFVADSVRARFVAKYNVAGVIQSVREISDPERNISKTIPRKNGGHYLIGDDYNVWTPGGTGKIITEKYDNFGNLEWQSWGISNLGGRIADIVEDQAGNVYITGDFSEDITFGSTVLTKQPGSYGNMFLVKYNANGQLQWARQTQSTPIAQANAQGFGGALAVDSLGNVYVTGGFINNISFAGQPPLQGSSAYRFQIFAAKYDSAGNFIWAQHAGGTENSSGSGITALSNGDAYVVGTYGQSGVNFGSIFLPNTIGGESFFLAKLSASPLSAAEYVSGVDFQLYPNPTASEVTISGEKLKQGNLTIYNLTGQKIYESQIDAEMKVNVASWPAGVYAVKLTSGSKTITRKLVVTH